MEIIFADGAGWRWFVSLGCHVVVAGRRTLRLHSQRRPHTVFVLGGHRCCRCQRRERPRKQDQQQESGGQASHSRELKRKASARRISHFDSRRTAAVGVGNCLKHRAVLPRAQPPKRAIGVWPVRGERGRRAGTPAAPLFDGRSPARGFLGGQTDFAEGLRASTYCTGNDAPQVETPSSAVVAS